MTIQNLLSIEFETEKDIIQVVKEINVLRKNNPADYFININNDIKLKCNGNQILESNRSEITVTELQCTNNKFNNILTIGLTKYINKNGKFVK